MSKLFFGLMMFFIGAIVFLNYIGESPWSLLSILMAVGALNMLLLWRMALLTKRIRNHDAEFSESISRIRNHIASGK